MKSKLLCVVLLLLAGLLMPSSIKAQGCQGVFSPNFSVYTNQALSSDGTTVIQTAQLEGYTGITQSRYCPMTSGAIHTPRVTNMIGSSGGAYNGPGSCPTCYVSFSNSLNFAATPGVIYTTNTAGAMICSVAGLFWSSAASILHLEIAFTRFVTGGYTLDTSVVPHQRDYIIGVYCTRATLPADWSPASPPIYFITLDPPGVPTGVVDGKTICVRAGTSGAWSCLPAGKWINSYNAPYVLGNCTHNP